MRMRDPVTIIDALAEELGVSGEARKKWRQRGRVSGQMRTPILIAAKERGIEIDLAAFDAFGNAKKSSKTAA